jgi:Na+:H+ antiporter, NhaB family
MSVTTHEKPLLLTAFASFMGHAPHAYKTGVLVALVFNVLLWQVAGPVAAAWAIVFEFIATLALSLKCYPLAPGGLLVIQAVLLGLTTPARIYAETLGGVSVLLLLIFTVSAISFMQELLVTIFARLLTAVRSPILLALLFCLIGTVLSAFLNAVTVLAMVMAVALGFYRIYFVAASGLVTPSDRQLDEDVHVPALRHAELQEFRAALRGLMMHAAVGSALGGVCTLVGEPQNVLIGQVMGWNFQRFAFETVPVAAPVVIAGLLTCVLLEKLRWFGFGAAIPPSVREILLAHERHEASHRTQRDRWRLIVQAAGALLLVVALAFSWAEVGLIGLALIVLLTLLTGVVEEHQLAEGFKMAIPFTALLVVFFAVVAVIHDRQLFHPLIQHVLAQSGREQIAWLYLANGALSAISDNVFVATVYITEIKRAFDAGQIPPDQYARLAVAVNVGTNIPSVATPNGQAAFLFLLTSSLAPLLRLSYGRMCWMALPYFVVLTVVGLFASIYWLH